MSLDNENIQSHYKRGHLLVQLERYEEALTAFDQGIHLELSKQEEDITCQYLSNLPSLYETYATKIEICEKLIQQTRNEMEKHSNLF